MCTIMVEVLRMNSMYWLDIKEQGMMVRVDIRGIQRSAPISQTLGVFMTCMAMYVNGALIGI